MAVDSKHIKTYGYISKGKLAIVNRQNFVEALSQWNDCRVIINIEKYYNKRSEKQNAYYWKIIIVEYITGVQEMWGDFIDKEEAHNQLKSHCNYKERINEKNGSIEKFVIDTKDLSTVEFNEYCEKCRRFIEEWFGIIIPLPNEQGEIFINENK
jgi:hypothetical protein